MSDIKEIRKNINKIDEQMAKLFEERMKLSNDVAKYKIENGLPILDAEREKIVIENNSKFIEDDEYKGYYIDFINSVMTISKNYQSKILNGMKVAYCGVQGAFAYIAAKKLFSTSKLLPFSSFQTAYDAVKNGYCDVVVLPLENSNAGDVGIVSDLIFQGPLYINNVIDVDIVHNLIAKKGVLLSDIKTVASHPQALAQCNKYINNHNFKTIECSNTAIAALELSKSDNNDVAVIASKDVAELYDLNILETNINESHNNTTRFATLSKTLAHNNNTNKMGEHFIIMFTVLNEAGALAKTLNIIGAHGFNMRTLRSRPMKQLQWNYYFYVELDGNINSTDGIDMINELKSVCDRLKVVGAYYSFADK